MDEDSEWSKHMVRLNLSERPWEPELAKLLRLLRVILLVVVLPLLLAGAVFVFRFISAIGAE